MNKFWRTEIIALVVIMLGLLWIGYEMYLDGTFIHLAIKYNMPEVVLPYDSAFFSPNPMGNVSGVYQIQTDKMEYKPGEEVFVYLSVCRYRDTPTTIRWTYTNDIIASTLPHPGQLFNTGCYKNGKVSIGTIPDELSAAFPDAKYNLHGAITSDVNPFRKVTYLFISNFFTIKK